MNLQCLQSSKVMNEGKEKKKIRHIVTAFNPTTGDFKLNAIHAIVRLLTQAQIYTLSQQEKKKKREPSMRLPTDEARACSGKSMN